MNRAVPFIAVGVIVGAGLCVNDSAGQLRREVNPPVRDTGLDAHETHAAATLLGQFRTSISSWLWLRTDLYLHNGVQMRPLSDAEVRAGVKGLGSHDNEDKKLHDDAKITTVVPASDRDFRGWMGDVERATQAFKDMRNHGHRDPKSALPLFRLMTWIDPQFIPGWTVGAHVLVSGNSPEGLERAVGLLQQGISHNPESVELYGELGHIQAVRWHRFGLALTSLERARQLSLRRPVPEDEDGHDAVRDTYRWLALVHRELGQLGGMYDAAREGAQRMPDDVILRRLANPPPSPLPIARQQAWLKALAETAPPPEH